jgi:hypothetical protein
VKKCFLRRFQVSTVGVFSKLPKWKELLLIFPAHTNDVSTSLGITRNSTGNLGLFLNRKELGELRVAAGNEPRKFLKYRQTNKQNVIH